MLNFLFIIHSIIYQKVFGYFDLLYYTTVVTIKSDMKIGQVVFPVCIRSIIGTSNDGRLYRQKLRVISRVDYWPANTYVWDSIL